MTKEIELRELDAEIAEKIFQWRWFKCVGTACLVPPGMALDWDAHPSLYTPLPDGPGKLKRDGIDGVYFYDSSRGGHTHPDIDSFSTNMQAALEVVEKLARWPKNCWMATIQNWNYYGDRYYTVVFRDSSIVNRIVEAKAKTLPKAICLAALDAMAYQITELK